MKPIRFILLFISIAVATSVVAQSPQRFNYQAVARDASGNPLSEKTLGVRISILDNTEAGTNLYSETSNPRTNKQGLFSIQVGGGETVSGSFNTIDWGASAKFLKVEIDAAGGSAYQLLGTSQLLSVPYAFVADRLSSRMSTQDLKDVSTVIPMTDQVLQWDGTQWTPGSGAALVTTSELQGLGTSADPLKIAPQGASNGQVMQWNGSQWAPATVTGGVGDNWGSQTIVSSTVLQGTGTSASPLTIAQQAAATGQSLVWNGSKWAPGSPPGDNWGTAKVNTSTQFSGDGTPGAPLRLAANSATTGQVLKFDGTNWVPGDGGSGSLTLPASANVADPGVAFQILNSTGTGIVGINSNANTANVYGVWGRTLTNTGAGTAGVHGRNGSTGSNGYGVYGLHDGSGVGVWGESTGGGVGITGKAGNNGIGLSASASGSTGIGVLGVAATALSGTTNTANGKGVYGNATAGGYAGWFDSKTMFRFNSTATDPNLYIWEDDMNDKAKIRFNNGVANEFWDITAFTPAAGGLGSDRFAVSHFSGGDIFTVTGDKKVGINLSNPETELDVNGSIKIIGGGIKANSSFGTNGQVLQSTGGGIQWGSATAAQNANTIFYEQTADVTNITTSSSLTGLNNMTFTLTQNAKVIMTFSHGQLVSNGSEVDLQVRLGFTTATSTIVKEVIMNDVIGAGKKKTISYTMHHTFTPGQYLPYVYIGTTSGSLKAMSGNNAGTITIQIIPE